MALACGSVVPYLLLIVFRPAGQKQSTKGEKPV
jgi:hypothetical protein